jgi:hypothetical protein
VGAFSELGRKAASHVELSQRLREAINDGRADLEVESVKQDDQCSFGRWLSNQGEDGFLSGADYLELSALHAEVHEEAARILSFAISGQPAKALTAMDPGSTFSRASLRLMIVLTRARAAA